MTVTFDLDPANPGSAPRDAATVLVLRDSSAGPEVFLVRRAAEARFMGGAYVFPGGRLDPGDADPALRCDLSPAEAAARLGDDDPARALALHVAAIRECFEESGILLADGVLPPDDHRALREALAPRGAPPLAALLPPTLRLRTRGLVPFARWITPRQETRRFDARFFLARAPATLAHARHDGHETVDSVWSTASAALDRAARGEIVLAPPTWRTLAELARARSVDEALATAVLAPPPREPCVILVDGEISVLLPDDPEHPQAEEPRDPAWPSRFRYAEGAWLPS